jgi:hypothetical protein
LHTLALRRFSPSILHERIPLLLTAAKSYHSKKECNDVKKEVEKLYQEDLKRCEYQ